MPENTIRENLGEGAEISEAEKIENILRRLGIERDENGQIVLYHTTTALNYAKILRDKAVLPPQKTGSRAWRNKDETEQQKMEKIYLCTKDRAEYIAGGLQQKNGGSFYVLETHVAQDGLYPDEDSGQSTWYDSLNTLRMCSYKGDINNFSLVKKIDLKLSKDEYLEIVYRNVDTVGKTAEEVHKLWDEKSEDIQEQENKLIRQKEKQEEAETEKILNLNK